MQKNNPIINNKDTPFSIKFTKLYNLSVSVFAAISLIIELISLIEVKIAIDVIFSDILYSIYDIYLMKFSNTKKTTIFYT